MILFFKHKSLTILWIWWKMLSTCLCFRVIHSIINLQPGLGFSKKFVLLYWTKLTSRLSCSENRKRSSIPNFLQEPVLFSILSLFVSKVTCLRIVYKRWSARNTLVPSFAFDVKSERILVKVCRKFRWSWISEWTSANIRKTIFCAPEWVRNGLFANWYSQHCMQP